MDILVHCGKDFNTQATKPMNTKFDKEVRQVEVDSYSLQKIILHVIKFPEEQFCVYCITVDFCGLVFPTAGVFPTYNESSFILQLGPATQWLGKTVTK